MPGPLPGRAGDGLLPTPPHPLPPVDRITRMVQQFNQGRISREDLMRVTTHTIVRCDDNWAAALLCLDQLHRGRDPDTGRPLQPDRIALNAAITCCAVARRWIEAVGLFNRMVAAGICPDSKTYTSVITACRRGGNTRDAIRMFEHLLVHASQVGVKPTIHTFTTVISAYGEAGMPDAALDLFCLLMSQGIEGQVRLHLRTYNAVLEVCAHAGRQADAHRILELVEHADPRSGVSPNIHSYFFAIAACDPQAGALLVDRAVARGLFEPSLGLHAERNVLYLRRNALAVRAFHAQNDQDLHPAVASAVFHHLTADGLIDATTLFVTNDGGSRALPQAVQERLAGGGGGGDDNGSSAAAAEAAVSA